MAEDTEPLNRAEMGLLMDLLLDAVINGDCQYVVIATEEVATASGLLDKFMRSMVSANNATIQRAEPQEETPTKDSVEDTGHASGTDAEIGVLRNDSESVP